jgi:hypothetical protein
VELLRVGLGGTYRHPYDCRTPGSDSLLQVMRFTLYVADSSDHRRQWYLTHEEYSVLVVLNSTDFDVHHHHITPSCRSARSDVSDRALSCDDIIQSMPHNLKDSDSKLEQSESTQQRRSGHNGGAVPIQRRGPSSSNVVVDASSGDTVTVTASDSESAGQAGYFCDSDSDSDAVALALTREEQVHEYLHGHDSDFKWEPDSEPDGPGPVPSSVRDSDCGRILPPGWSPACPRVGVASRYSASLAESRRDRHSDSEPDSQSDSDTDADANITGTLNLKLRSEGLRPAQSPGPGRWQFGSDSELDTSVRLGRKLLQRHPVLRRHLQRRRLKLHHDSDFKLDLDFDSRAESDSGSICKSRAKSVSNSPMSENLRVKLNLNTNMKSTRRPVDQASESTVPSSTWSQPAGRRARALLASGCSHGLTRRPLRIVFTGDATAYDGMKANLAQQVRRLRAAGFSMAYLNTVCRELDGMYFQLEVDSDFPPSPHQ